MSRAPVLLCFDGSACAANAIATAGELLGPRPAILLTVREPATAWAPYDPVTVIDAGLARLGTKTLGLDEIADEIAGERLARGLQLARAAGFDAHGEIAIGKPWRAICDTGERVGAAVIVLGANGASRLAAELLGSVSASVTAHAGRPVLVVRPS